MKSLPYGFSNRCGFLLIVVIMGVPISMEVTIRFLMMREKHAEDI
jgi:hypothetical protein